MLIHATRSTRNRSKIKYGRVAEWFKAPVLKTGRGLTLSRGFESHPFRQQPSFAILGPPDSRPASSKSATRHLTSQTRCEMTGTQKCLCVGAFGERSPCPIQNALELGWFIFKSAQPTLVLLGRRQQSLAFCNRPICGLYGWQSKKASPHTFPAAPNTISKEIGCEQLHCTRLAIERPKRAAV